MLVNVSKQHSYTKPSEEYLMLILKVLHFPRKTIICFEVAIIGNRAQTSSSRNWSIKKKTITHPIAEKKMCFDLQTYTCIRSKCKRTKHEKLFICKWLKDTKAYYVFINLAQIQQQAEHKVQVFIKLGLCCNKTIRCK